MLFVTLAALSGLVWGVGDFAGGKAAQTAPAMRVAWLSKLIALPLLAIFVAATYVAPSVASLAYGAAGGLCGILGMIMFYRALSAGAMTVVAPVTAVTSAAIPVVVGLVQGERPPALRLIGVGCALVAIALISLSPPHPGQLVRATPRLVAAAIGAGAGFAMFFILVAQAGRVAHGSAGLWPIAASHVAALVLGGILLLVRRPGDWPRGRALRWTFVCGPFDMSANALYLLATRHGELSLVAPLAALYPVTTVILALLIDRERLRVIQFVGMIFAVLALVLVSR